MRTFDTSIIDRWMKAVWQRRGTDLHCTVGAPPVGRFDGRLEAIEGAPVLEGDDIERIVATLLGRESYDAFLEERQHDFGFDWGGEARVRANAFFQRGHVALSLRIIPDTIPTVAELGLPAICDRLVDLPQGLVIVTGPTGAGKTTSLAALIDAINTRRPAHVITVEEPIEFVHHHKRSLVNQREVGVDCTSFESALRAALREDPDVLLVGEMRDLETIAIALTMAETGHLVFATMHTNDAAQSMDRIVDVFPAASQNQIRVQLAGSLAAVISQRLLPRIGGGRVAAFEILIATSGVRNLVRDGKSAQLRNMITTGASAGMQTLESSLAEHVLARTIDYETALAASLFSKELQERVGR